MQNDLSVKASGHTEGKNVRKKEGVDRKKSGQAGRQASRQADWPVTLAWDLAGIGFILSILLEGKLPWAQFPSEQRNGFSQPTTQKQACLQSL